MLFCHIVISEIGNPLALAIKSVGEAGVQGYAMQAGVGQGSQLTSANPRLTALIYNDAVCCGCCLDLGSNVTPAAGFASKAEVAKAPKGTWGIGLGRCNGQSPRPRIRASLTRLARHPSGELLGAEAICLVLNLERPAREPRRREDILAAPGHSRGLVEALKADIHGHCTFPIWSVDSRQALHAKSTKHNERSGRRVASSI